MAAADRFVATHERVHTVLQGPSEEKWQGAYAFVQLADSQLGMLNAAWNDRRRGDVKDWKREQEMLDMAVAYVNRIRPRFVVVCGDLVNAFPYGDDKELQELQVQDFKKSMSKVDPSIHLLCLCGNHDIGDRPNATTIDLYRQRFGDDYFVFWAGGVRCIVLNSQLYKDGEDAKAEAAAQDQWLRGVLATKTEPYSIVFSHIPPFISSAEEDSGYFNLEQALRVRLLDTMIDGGVRAWFCGHYHRNSGGIYKSLEVIVSSAVGTTLQPSGIDPLGLRGFKDPDCGVWTSGLRVVKVQHDAIVHRFFTMDSLPDKVDADSSAW